MSGDDKTQKRTIDVFNPQGFWRVFDFAIKTAHVDVDASERHHGDNVPIARKSEWRRRSLFLVSFFFVFCFLAREIHSHVFSQCPCGSMFYYQASGFVFFV